MGLSVYTHICIERDPRTHVLYTSGGARYAVQRFLRHLSTELTRLDSRCSTDRFSDLWLRCSSVFTERQPERAAAASAGGKTVSAGGGCSKGGRQGGQSEVRPHFPKLHFCWL